jgi:hypothetical protein
MAILSLPKEHRMAQLFDEIFRKIEAEGKPFIRPALRRRPGAAFSQEKVGTDKPLAVAGRCCISMLSVSVPTSAY